MSYRYERRRSKIGCLAWLVAIVWIILLALLAYRFLFRPQVSQFIGEQLGEQLRSSVEGQAERDAEQQILEGSQDALPTVVAGLPSGELRISEAQANDYIASQAGSFGPLDTITVRFVPGEIQADLTAMGATSTARMGLAVQDGRIIALNPRLDGVLAQFISLEELARSLEQQFNDQLASQGRRATDVRIEQGELVVTIEG